MVNIGNSIKSNWKPIVWGLIPVVILAIAFALPIKTVSVEKTEQYWDTEMKKEPYTVSESYTTVEPYTATETRAETIHDAYAYLGNWSHDFEVNNANSIVSIEIHGYAYYPGGYRIICPGGDVDSCAIWPYSYYWGSGQSKVTVKVTYPEEVTKYKTVTKYRDVTKYREVQTRVLKERTVTENIKMSIWAYLFS